MTDHPLTKYGERRAFFGRRAGKTLHAGQAQRVARLLSHVTARLGEGPIAPEELFAGCTAYAIEIGYGGGEHLARLAARHRDIGYLGCEVFLGGIAKMLAAIEQDGLGNIRLFSDDALQLLVKLPAASLNAAYLLYPDPWPKTRHHKRRFVSATTLGEVARILRPGGRFRFATDIEDYADWTLAHALREPRLRFMPEAPGAWHTPFADWQPTRYESKARAAGRAVSFYFEFSRV